MAVTDERIVELRLKQKAHADSHRDYYEDRWIRNWSLYRNTRQTRAYKMQPWNSNRQIPDAFRLVETLLPQHVLGMFRNPNWFSVEASTVAGQTYQEMVRSLLLQGWRKADGFRKTVEGMKMGTVLGHFCPKTTWKQEIGELVIQDTDYTLTPEGEPMDAGYVERTIPYVTHNGPQIEFPDLFNIWQDPTGAGMFWIERIPTSFTRLEDTNRKFSGNLYKNMAKLKAEIAMSPSPQPRYSTGAAYDQPLSTTVDGVPEQFADDSVELLQCWGYVPPSVKKYDDTQWRLQVIANECVLLRDEPAPTHDHRAPYDNVQSIPIPGQIYGDSVLSYVGDLIELRSEIENMRRDEIMLNIFGTYGIDGRAQIRGQDMIKTPGGAIRVTPPIGLDIPPQNLVWKFPQTPVLPDAYNESAIKERQMDQTAGAFKTFQGEAFGGRTSASEVGQIMGHSTARIQLATMLMDESFKRPVLTRMFKLYQSKLTTPEMVALVGQPDIRGEIDFTDLRYDVDIHVDSGLYGSMDSMQAQNAMQVYQVVMSDPMGRAWVNFPRFLKSINYRLGLSGTSDDFINSPEEAQAAMAQMAQMAQAEGGAPAAPA